MQVHNQGKTKRVLEGASSTREAHILCDLVGNRCIHLEREHSGGRRDKLHFPPSVTFVVFQYSNNNFIELSIMKFKRLPLGFISVTPPLAVGPLHTLVPNTVVLKLVHTVLQPCSSETES